MVSKALEYGLTPAGRLKVGETKLPPIGGEKDARAPSSPTAKIRASKSSFLPPAVNDALEVLSACRGHGWDFGKGVHLPKEHRPLERAGFLKATCKIFFKNFLLLDFLESCSKLVPALTSPSGGSMFLPLPPVQRYTVSTALHILTGTALIASLEIAYAFVTLAGVGVFQQSPLLWPPFLDHPFSSDSLSDFWAKRWHQLLRRSFVVYGGYPAFWLGSLVSKEVAKVFMVIGVFIASGLYHELSTDTMGRGFDKHITLFFVLQAFGVMGERVWYKVTGRKVQGWIGLIWVYFCIMVLGQPCGECSCVDSLSGRNPLTHPDQPKVDAWYNRGLGTSVFIPAVISPTRNILWPILKRVHPIFQLLP